MDENREWLEHTQKVTNFLTINRSFIVNALEVHARRMRDSEMTTRKQYAEATTDPEVAARYERSMMTVAGLKNSATMFDQEATKAERLVKELDKLMDEAP